MNNEYEDGFKALKKKNFEIANRNFLTIIEQKPENAESHYGLSVSFFELGNVDSAEKHARAAFSLFEAQHKLSEAYVCVNDLISIKPDMLKYSFDLLRIYLKIKFTRSFVEDLLQIMDSEEIEEDVLIENLSSLTPYIKNEKLKSILSFKKKVGKEEEKLNPFENLELANLLFEIGSIDEAKDEFYKTAQAFLNRNLKNKAQELYVKIKEIYPDDSELEQLKKEIESYSGKKEKINLRERRDNLQTELTFVVNESEARVRYSFSVFYKEFARFEKAKEELQKIFALPKSIEKIRAYVLLSQICIDAQDNLNAIMTLENVIESDEFSGSEVVPLEYKLGTIYERMQKLHEALKIYEKAQGKDHEYLDLEEKVKNVREKIEKQESELLISTVEETTKMEEEGEEEPMEKEVKRDIQKVKEEVTLRKRILYI